MSHRQVGGQRTSTCKEEEGIARGGWGWSVENEEASWDSLEPGMPDMALPGAYANDELAM
jgi:hypothetical protein